LEEPLRILLEHGAEGPWRFDDVEIDSGEFGEIASRDLVESVGAETYRLVDRSAVARALDEPQFVESPVESEKGDLFGWLRPFLTPHKLVLLGVFAVLIAVRTIPAYTAVFRPEFVVLSGNDPYYYRYWLDQLMAGQIEIGQLSTGEEYLYLVTLFLIAKAGNVIGVGSGTVMAWFPVFMAALTGIFVYFATYTVTQRKWLGTAAVAVLASTPVHAFRMSLGFADHDAFDNVWLIFTALLLTLLLVERHDSDRHSARAWALGVGLGIGVAAQTLAWRGGTLMLLPVGAYVAAKGWTDVRLNRSPVFVNLPAIIGLGLGAVLAFLPHELLSWGPVRRLIVPTILLLGVLSSLLAAEFAYRLGFKWAGTAVAEAIGLSTISFSIWQFTPWLDQLFQAGSGFFERTGEAGIGETISLFGFPIAGPGPESITGTFLFFGFMFLLAMPPLLSRSVQVLRRPDDCAPWLPFLIYAWFFIGLVAEQVRFGDQLALFIPPFAALSLWWIAGWGGIVPHPRFEYVRARNQSKPPRRDIQTKPPRRDIQTCLRNKSELSSAPTVSRLAAAGIVIVWLVTGLAIAPLTINEVNYTQGQYEAAAHAAEWSTAHDLEYPENYVFSRWGRNRMYNYFVSGESKSYTFAKDNYEQFLLSTGANSWYQEHEDRIGFIVTRPGRENQFYQAAAMQIRLHEYNGGTVGGTPGVGHYRAIYISDDGSVKAFAVVPGALLVGEASPAQDLAISTTVSVTGSEFEYSRTIRTDGNGRYRVRVAYPGEYTIGGETIQVSGQAVQSGQQVNVTTE